MDNTNQQLPSNQNINQPQPYSPPRSKTSKTVTTVAMVVLIIIIIGGIGGYVLGTRKSTVIRNQQSITTSPTILPTTPMPTSPSTPDSTQPLVGDIVFPQDSGIINVKNYGAKGDGVTDDTRAIQRAISENLGKKEKGLTAVIYFPAGTYLVSGSLLPKADASAQGGWIPYLTLQGQNRDKSIIKLKDNALGYGDKGIPRAVLFTASNKESSSTFDWIGKGEGNAAFNNNIFDLTVDTGKGNPGAIGIDYLANNNGSVRNVKIVSADGQGSIGLSLARNSPGPSLIKNVTIEGFDYGIKSEHVTYISTLEHITLRNQKIAGIYNAQHVLAIRDLQSENSVSAIIQQGKSGFITLIDGSFTGVSPSVSAIQNDAGELFARNITSTGYKSAIKNKSSIISGQSISEFVSNGPYSLFPSPQTSLNLPVQDPPEVPWDPVDQWISVKDYGANGNASTTFDNSPAVQKAIDEANKLGRTTLYFPKGQYAFGDTIRIYGTIRRVHRMMSSFGTVNSPANKFADGRPSFQIDEGTHPALLIEGGGRRFDTGSTIEPKLGVKHISSKTLVLRNLGGTYENVPGSGPVFFEDMQGCSVFHSTKVWARQLNPERCGVDPKILNDGSDLWILGLKTEQPATIIETRNGGRTEVLGGLIYPTDPVPADMPAFVNKDSSHSLSFVIYAHKVAASHQIIVKETRNGVTKQLTKSQVPSRAQGSMVPFFAGYLEGAPTHTPKPTPSPTPTPTPTPSGSDTTPPVISNIQPQGVLPFSTKKVTITLQTNEPTRCAISDSPILINQPNPKLFTITGGTSHSITAPPVEKGKSYTFYARCKDKAGNITPKDTIIQFSIEKAGKRGASPMSNLLPIAIISLIGIGIIFFIVRRLRKKKDSIV